VSLGILDLVGLVATLIFALPVAGYGVERALGGDPVVGAAFLVVAALMVVLPQKLTTPGDLPSVIAERAVGKAVSTDDDEE
jgi:hypothetical protein